MRRCYDRVSFYARYVIQASNDDNDHERRRFREEFLRTNIAIFARKRRFQRRELEPILARTRDERKLLKRALSLSLSFVEVPFFVRGEMTNVAMIIAY